MKPRTRALLAAVAVPALVTAGAVHAQTKPKTTKPAAPAPAPAPAAAAPAPTGAAVQMRVVRETDLRADPALDARVVGKVTADQVVSQIDNDGGGWARVRIGTLNGWLRVNSLRAAAATPAPSATQSASGLSAGIASLTARSSGPTATTGAGGLQRKELEQAKPVPQEVQLMDQYAVTAAQAESFARAARLTRQTVPALNDKGGE